MIKVSIIIATYNAAKTLKVALDSVLNQSYQDWECIIVDGASSDNTIDIILSYIERDSRFRYISEPDNGIYDAFNKGWQMANGKWIYYLGADDLLLPYAFSNIFLNNINDSEIVYGNVVFNTGNKLKYKKSIKPNELKGKMVSHQCILMKKDTIKLLGGFDLNYHVCADYDLLYRSIINNAKIKYIDIYFAIFNCSGITGSSISNIKESYQIKKKYGIKKGLNLYIWYTKTYLKKKIKLELKHVYEIFTNK